MNNEREILIPLVPVSDFDKLLFAQSHIKELTKKISELEIKIGILQSDLSEKNDEPSVADLKNKLNEVNKNNVTKAQYIIELQAYITKQEVYIKKQNATIDRLKEGRKKS